MANPMDEPYQKALDAARLRVQGKIRFFRHLGMYLAVNLVLAVVTLALAAWNWWILAPVLAWGMVLALHGAQALGLLSQRRGKEGAS